MQSTEDNRPEHFFTLENLLYGYNYAIWVNVYGPLDANQSLQSALQSAISLHSIPSRVTPLSAKDLQKEVIECLLYPGDSGVVVNYFQTPR